MNCPVCDVPLIVSVRQGVEVDYCPECRGVWLDRGELDRIIEGSALAPSLLDEAGDLLPGRFPAAAAVSDALSPADAYNGSGQPQTLPAFWQELADIE